MFLEGEGGVWPEKHEEAKKDPGPKETKKHEGFGGEGGSRNRRNQKHVFLVQPLIEKHCGVRIKINSF